MMVSAPHESDNPQSVEVGADAFELKLDDSMELSAAQCYQLLEQIDNCSDPEQISKVQAKLSSDYKDIVTEFANARLTRIEELITIIEKTSKTISKNNDKFELQMAQKLPVANEKYGIEIERPVRKYRRTSSHSQNNNLRTSPLTSPPILPADLDVPIFKDAFSALSAPYNSNLDNIKNKYDHQRRLIERRTHSSKGIIWRQFFDQRQELKAKKLSALSEELQELEYEYRGMRNNVKARSESLSRRKSRSPKSVQKDINKKLTEKLVQKIEYLGKIAQEEKRGLVPLVTQFEPIQGLTQNEVDLDLALIKYWGDKEDETYKATKAQKILDARKAVELRNKESASKLKKLIEKQAKDVKKSKIDFIKQQEEFLGFNQSSQGLQHPAFPVVPPHMIFPAMRFMPPFMQPPFPPFYAPQPMPLPDAEQQDGSFDVRQNMGEDHGAIIPSNQPEEELQRPHKARSVSPPASYSLLQELPQEQEQEQEQDQHQSGVSEEAWNAGSSSQPIHRSSSTPSTSAISIDDQQKQFKAKNMKSPLRMTPSNSGEITTIKDIIAMKDREGATSSFKRYYTANQN